MRQADGSHELRSRPRPRQRVGERRARLAGAHDRLRPPLRHLQAGHPAAVAARAAEGAAHATPTGRCSSCSPARRTPPTSRGKALIQRRSSCSPTSSTCATAFVFLDDYDIASPARCTRAPTCGSTTRAGRWRRAASSGMKAALNGALNCCDPRRLVGRVPSTARTAGPSTPPTTTPTERRARRTESGSLSLSVVLGARSCAVLRRRSPRLPRLDRQGQATTGPASARRSPRRRMVRDYVTELYEPPAGQPRGRRARATRQPDLAAWKQHVDAGWGQVAFVEVDARRRTSSRPTSVTAGVKRPRQGAPGARPAVGRRRDGAS